MNFNLFNNPFKPKPEEEKPLNALDNTTITIKVKDMGKDNYGSNMECPIACGLKRNGFEIKLHGSTFFVVDKDGIRYWGSIDDDQERWAKKISVNPTNKNVIMKFPLQATKDWDGID